MSNGEKSPLESKKFFDLSPKVAFIFGLLVGVVVISVLGALIIFSQPNLTAVSSGDNSAVKTGSAVNAAKPANVNINSNVNATLPAPIKVDLAIGTGDHVKGGSEAKVKIFYFTDLECPYSQRFHPTIEQAIGEYGDKIAVVFKHFPLSFHTNAQPAAVAAECVADSLGENEFWDYAGKLYADQGKLSRDFFVQTAVGLGAKQKAFESCLDSGKKDGKIQADYQDGIAAGVKGTPASFVNGRLLSGAVSYERLKAAIETSLKD